MSTEIVRQFLVERMSLRWAIMACFKKHVKDSQEPLRPEQALILADIVDQREFTREQFVHLVKTLNMDWWTEYGVRVQLVAENLLRQCTWRSLQPSKVHYFLSNYGFPDMFMCISAHWMETASIEQKVHLARDLFLCLKTARKFKGYVDARTVFRLEEDNQRMLQYCQWIDVERLKTVDRLHTVLKENPETTMETMEQTKTTENTTEPAAQVDQSTQPTDFGGLFNCVAEQVDEMIGSSLGQTYLNIMGMGRHKFDTPTPEGEITVEQTVEQQIQSLLINWPSLRLYSATLWPSLSVFTGESENPLVQFLLEVSDVLVKKEQLVADDVFVVVAQLQALFIQYVYPDYTRVVDGQVVVSSDFIEALKAIQPNEMEDLTTVTTFVVNLCQHYTVSLDSLSDAVMSTGIAILQSKQPATENPLQSGLDTLANQ
jgi:hypothetical protein